MTAEFERLLAVALLSLALAPAYAQRDASIELGAEYGAFAGPGIRASASASAETIGGILSLRMGATGSAIARSSGEGSGTGDLFAEFSAAGEQVLVLGSLSGGADFGPSVPAWRAAASLLLELQSEALSASLRPRALYDGAIDGGKELGLEAGLSILAGEMALKPGFDFAGQEAQDGTRSLSLRPRLGLSWYPSFPLSLSLSAGLRRSWPESGSCYDELPSIASLYGALGRIFLFRIEAAADLSLPSLAAGSWSTLAELEPVLCSSKAGELRLPLRFTWASETDFGPSFFAGLRLVLE